MGPYRSMLNAAGINDGFTCADLGLGPCAEFRVLVGIFRRRLVLKLVTVKETAVAMAVLHQSPDKRGVPLPVKMVSQLTQTWHSQVRSFC